MGKNKSKQMQRYVVVATVIVVLILCWAGLTRSGFIPNFLNIEFLCSEQNDPSYPYPPIWGDQDNTLKKPVIFLYPQSIQDVAVKLDLEGDLLTTYPTYDEMTGWQVTAYPDGKLINKSDGKEYSYLFWEGVSNAKYDLSKGFVVKGADSREFLQEKLSYLGLTPKEYNEFIVYWYPQLKKNAYNLISFAGKEYTDSAPLTITPSPDSVLRVFMAYKPLDKPIQIEPQILSPFERKGFTVVEWGGSEL